MPHSIGIKDIALANRRGVRMMRRKRILATRGAVLLTTCVLTLGVSLIPVGSASAAQSSSDSSSRVDTLGYGNLLCKLFPDLVFVRRSDAQVPEGEIH